MYCAWRIPAHLRCTQCAILLHLMDIVHIIFWLWLSVLNFIPDRRSSKLSMWTVAFDMYSKGHRPHHGKICPVEHNSVKNFSFNHDQAHKLVV